MPKTIILDTSCFIVLSKIAQQLGLTVTGTIGVIVKAKLEGKIASITPYLDKMKSTNFRCNGQN